MKYLSRSFRKSHLQFFGSKVTQILYKPSGTSSFLSSGVDPKTINTKRDARGNVSEGFFDSRQPLLFLAKSCYSVRTIITWSTVIQI